MVKHRQHQRRYSHDAFCSGEPKCTRYVRHNLTTDRQQCFAVVTFYVRFLYKPKKLQSRSVLMGTAEPNEFETRTFPSRSVTVCKLLRTEH